MSGGFSGIGSVPIDDARTAYGDPLECGELTVSEVWGSGDPGIELLTPLGRLYLTDDAARRLAGLLATATEIRALPNQTGSRSRDYVSERLSSLTRDVPATPAGQQEGTTA